MRRCQHEVWCLKGENRCPKSIKRQKLQRKELQAEESSLNWKASRILLILRGKESPTKNFLILFEFQSVTSFLVRLPLLRAIRMHRINVTTRYTG